MKQPLVSCIMPTANREKFIPLALGYFLGQEYPNKELIIVDDGKQSIQHLIPDDTRIKYFYSDPIGTIGLKRNYACERASGEIIMHWDDDDWYAGDWIGESVNFLINSEADMCGIDAVYFYDVIKNKLTLMNRIFPNGYNPKDWVTGASLAYWKTFWEKHPFKDLQTGEDDDFIRNSGAKLYIHDYSMGFICVLHPRNTVIRGFENPKYKSQLK